MGDNYAINWSFFIDERYKPIAFYPIENNECCDKDFFILTANKTPHGMNYSCQCACGMWCTSGFATEQQAVNAYRSMCNKANK